MRPRPKWNWCDACGTKTRRPNRSLRESGRSFYRLELPHSSMRPEIGRPDVLITLPAPNAICSWPITLNTRLSPSAPSRFPSGIPATGCQLLAARSNTATPGSRLADDCHNDLTSLTLPFTDFRPMQTERNALRVPFQISINRRCYVA